MSRAKRIFEKSCSIAVIMYLSYPFLIKTGKEIKLFYGRLVEFLWTMMEGYEIVIAVLICFLGICLILWIFRDDGEEKETGSEEEQVKE